MGDRTKSRIKATSRTEVRLPQPPWTQAPKEVASWLTFGTRKERSSGDLRDEEFLRDPRIEIDLLHAGEVEHRTIRQWILGRTGRDIVVENFDILPITEGILRALSKIRFRNVSTLAADGRKAYDHPEQKKDLKDVLRHLSDLMLEGVSRVHLEVLRGGSSASVDISTVHRRRGHSIKILFHGRMKCKTLNSFVKSLSEELPIGKLQTSP